jgi:hypothetical protein
MPILNLTTKYLNIKLLWSVDSFFSILGCSGTESTITEVITGLLYPPRMMMNDDECRAVGGIIGRGNRSTRRKPTPVTLCPSWSPHDLNRDRTQAAAMGFMRLSTWGTTRPPLIVAQLVKKSPALYGARTFIIVVRKEIYPVLDPFNLLQTFTYKRPF